MPVGINAAGTYKVIRVDNADTATGGGTTKTISTSLIYNADITVIGWVRHGDEAAPDTPAILSGVIGSAGYSASVTLSNE